MISKGLVEYNATNHTNITNKKQHVRALINNTRVQLGMPLILAMTDPASLPKVLDGVNTDKQDMSLGSTGATEEYDEFAQYDMTPFSDAYEIKEFCVKDINFDYQKGKTDIAQENKCINIGDTNIVFSNYTIEGTKGVDCWDISYSQFWNENAEEIKNSEKKYDINDEYNPHFLLYRYDAGDFSRENSDTGARATRMIFGQYRLNPSDSDRRDIIDGDEANGISGYGKVYKYKNKEYIYDKNGYTATMKTLDGRIIAAFPMHLLIAKNEDIVKELYYNQMHKYRNYLDLSTKAYAGRFQRNNHTKDIRKLAEDYRMYRYVDVVVQSADEYQYVIPFMCVDMKALHHDQATEENAYKYIHHHSMITDNTYGHVYDRIVNGILQYSHMNPIEPYIQIKKDKKIDDGNGNLITVKDYHDAKIDEDNVNVDLNNIVANIIFDMENVRDIKDKIISIRIYEKTWDKSNPNWWTEKRDNMKKVASKDEYNSGVILNRYHNDGKVVDY